MLVRTVKAEGRTNPPDIQARTYQFALRVVRLVRALGNDTASIVCARQVMRSGTSVGANVQEAQGSHSRAEFARRMGIARSEAQETLYWLRLLKDAGLVPAAKMESILKEADEIVRTLVAIVKSTRGRQ